MMAENPNFWWSLNGKPPLVVSQQPSTNFLSPPPPPGPPQPSSNNFFPPQYLFGASPAALLPPNSLLHHDHSQDHFPLSWSQLLMGGLTSDHQEESGGTSSNNCGQFKRLENWEDHQILNPSLRVPIVGAVKRELDQTRHLIYNNSNNHHGEDDELQACSSSWSSHVNPIPSSAGSSCVSSATNVLDFSTNKRDQKNQHSQHSSVCNGTSTSGTPAKKARVQPSSSQPPLKIRKEKLGDRITALHQIVSPFGKTDTASVLLEAIGYIRFLEGQIEALSSPYLGNASGRLRNQHFVKGERRCISTEEPGQDTGKDATNDGELRSRGLCLVPVSCTDHIDIGNNNGSDYWAPALGGGGGGF